MAASLVVEALLDEYKDCVSILDFVDEDELLLKPESADEFEESSTPIESFRGLLTIKLTSLSLSIVFMLLIWAQSSVPCNTQSFIKSKRRRFMTPQRRA